MKLSKQDLADIERIGDLAIGILSEVAPFTIQNGNAAKILGLACRLKFRLDPDAKRKHDAAVKKYRDRAVERRFGKA